VNFIAISTGKQTLGMPIPAKSKVKTELEFLSALEGGGIVTQMTLSKRVGVAVGLINALLRRAMLKGYVKAKAAPYKRYAYYLTPKGFSEKSRLVAEYLEVSLEFFRQARREYEEVFLRARKAGLHRVILIGGGELAEIAVIAARAVDFELAAILDCETNRDHFHGVRVVRSVAELDVVDGVVIADSRTPQESYMRLRASFTPQMILAPPLLKITTDEPEEDTAFAVTRSS
jgi:hypothetical protein